MILKETQLNKPGPIRLRFYAGLFTTFWTLIVVLLLIWNVRDQRRDLKGTFNTSILTNVVAVIIAVLISIIFGILVTNSISTPPAA
ncbi:MAG: hypothetical protein FVQ80_18260 [Planctomycetes bacterium]|nr:hypothetical protein [Planctomycetota bacterium]